MIEPSKPRWGRLGPKLSEEDLFSALDKMPDDRVRDYGRCNFTTAQFIIVRFLGFEWWSRHVWTPNDYPTKAGFFGLDFSSDERREEKTQRTLDLAELLFNLQCVEGFGDCLSRLQSGSTDQTESTYAELQVGKLLFAHAADFRFVARTMRTREADYDYQILHPNGFLICGETKCKLVASSLNAGSVLSSLKKAAKQLPKSEPSIIFAKVPQHWFENSKAVGNTLRDVAGEFFRNTSRVVSLVYYVPFVRLRGETVSQRHLFDEIGNARNRFPPQDWRLFERDGVEVWQFLFDTTEKYRSRRFG